MSDFSELVLKDVKEGVSEEEESVLLDNPEEWREELIQLLRRAETEIKTPLQVSKPLPKAEWNKKEIARRRTAIAFKEDILIRMREVKAILRDKNIEESEVSGTNKTLMLILAEMQSVRRLLEERAKP
ncbi:MAG: hypothetical protein V4568_14595 [Pseudomonadota bacterium]